MKTLFQGKILTIPNILSLMRICMIPLFVWTYLAKENYMATAAILILSGLTDLTDGMIARRFNMVSNLGKALDPFADKLTQAAIMICLGYRFPRILILLAVLFIKEVFCGVTSLMQISHTGEIRSSDWHGKMATSLIDGTVILHLIWPGITENVSTGLILLCTGMVLLSGILYGMKNFRMIRTSKKP